MDLPIVEVNKCLQDSLIKKNFGHQLGEDRLEAFKPWSTFIYSMIIIIMFHVHSCMHMIQNDTHDICCVANLRKDSSNIYYCRSVL